MLQVAKQTAAGKYGTTMPIITAAITSESYPNNGSAGSLSSPLPGLNQGESVDLASSVDLIFQIKADIAALGVIGEEYNSLLIYLVGTSRLRKHPLRIIIRGLSGSGKSFPVTRVTLLFPQEVVIEATSLTPQALYYGEPGWLEHKFIVQGERSHRTDDEAADSTAALRQLFSEDRIVKRVTINKETVTIEQNGPVASCVTTTAKSIFAEDLNRCLQVYADESPEQTKRILQAAAQPYLGETVHDPQPIIERHHQFQQSLQDIDVVIPYADQLADHMPTDKLQSRRVIKQVLATVETLTFLHQHHRDRDKDGRLVATADDYQVARQLLLRPVDEAVGPSDRARNAYHDLKDEFPQQGFTSTQTVKAGIFNNKMTCKRALDDLVELGVIRCAAEARGSKPRQWAWTGKPLKPVLPETLA